MSLRLPYLVLALALGMTPSACGGAAADADEPQTAREKQLQEAKASGEVDPPGKQWGGWRYQGDRKDCFYVVGRRCFKTDKAACSNACRTKSASTEMCAIDGGGPATVSCKKKS
jgi:hypothetical protein